MLAVLSEAINSNWYSVVDVAVVVDLVVVVNLVVEVVVVVVVVVVLSHIKSVVELGSFAASYPGGHEDHGVQIGKVAFRYEPSGHIMHPRSENAFGVDTSWYPGMQLATHAWQATPSALNEPCGQLVHEMSRSARQAVTTSDPG